MYYKEWLYVRRSLTVLAIALAVLLGILVFVNLLVTYAHASGQAHSALPSATTNLVELLGTASLLVGGIMATVFGAALAKENVGHLELAWTKPYSRTAYASAVMLVDAAGILIAVVLGLIVHALTHAAFGLPISVGAGPGTLGDIARYLLFPLAWYGVIVALSASLRGAGLVQGLIWPIALILMVLQAAPLPPVWHGLAGVLNIVNLLIYIQSGSGLSLMSSNALSSSALFADFGLALLVLGSWALATTQWRRLEA